MMRRRHHWRMHQRCLYLCSGVAPHLAQQHHQDLAWDAQAHHLPFPIHCHHHSEMLKLKRLSLPCYNRQALLKFKRLTFSGSLVKASGKAQRRCGVGESGPGSGGASLQCQMPRLRGTDSGSGARFLLEAGEGEGPELLEAGARRGRRGNSSGRPGLVRRGVRAVVRRGRGRKEAEARRAVPTGR